jgi:putative ABC transport system substrate-binding protein
MQAFAVFRRERAEAVFVANNGFFASRRVQFATLAARGGLPTSYGLREFVEAGGLMSYGANFSDGWRLAGTYAGRILMGEAPANLPVVQATKFEFVINLGTAKALGLTIPETLLATADEVIQ